MGPFRIIFVLSSAALVAAAFYLSYNGVWQESSDLDRSVRIGGVGGYSGGRIK